MISSSSRWPRPRCSYRSRRRAPSTQIRGLLDSIHCDTDCVPRISRLKLRDTIAEVLYPTSAYELADVCDELGMPPAAPNVDPMSSKRTYVKSRLKGMDDSAMLAIARRVLNEMPDESLAAIVAEAGGLGSEPANPHRPLTAAEVKRRSDLAAFLDTCSEDELIEEVLLPLFRQLGFHRITAAGHKDKALEYGKDIWMRYTLPTQHYLYFGIQAKKGKVDASGVTKPGNANVAEIHTQALMMLAHEIFDPETNKRVLVDHAFIVAGGEITKAARNWIGNALDASKRSQIMFIDRDDILNLYVVTNVPLPAGALPPAPQDPWGRTSDGPPF
jgi:hypothetical protein